MRALSVRQPYAEMILRGIKTAEYRSRPTRIVGERFYLYASKKPAAWTGPAVWSGDLEVPHTQPPAWMLELAGQLKLFGSHDTLPTGVVVGSAVIDRVTRGDDGLYRWHLAGVERAKRLRKPTGHPQPTWFEPF